MAHIAPKQKETRSRAKKRKDDFLKLALARFQMASDAEANWRRDALDDLKFSVGEQWTATVESQRQQDGRPCLVMNRLPAFMHQITNQQRQQQPAVQINPVGSGADVKIAEVIQGLFRHIEVNSEAEVAYDHAMDLMVRTGKGAWRIITDYTDNGTDDEQDIYVAGSRISSHFTPTPRQSYQTAAMPSGGSSSLICRSRISLKAMAKILHPLAITSRLAMPLPIG